MRVKHQALPCYEITEALLVAGANPNTRDEQNNSPLCNASAAGNLESVRALLAHGADVNSRALYDRTALHLAATCRVAAYLLDHGADVNVQDSDGDTPLMGRALIDVDIARLLLQHHATVNARNKRGNSALVRAVDVGALEAVNLLLEAGADHNLSAGDVRELVKYRWCLRNICFGPSSYPNPKRELLLGKLR